MQFLNRIATVAAIAATLTALGTTTAHAQTFYTDLASFNAAAPTTTLYDFEGISGFFSSNPDVLVNPAPGRVTFSVSGGLDGTVYASDSSASNGGYSLSDNSDSVAAGLSFLSLSTTTVALDAAYTAFAIEYGVQKNETTPNSFTIELYSGNTLVGTSFSSGSFTGPNFFGATSTTAFDNVRFAVGNETGAYATFDNARVGSALVSVAAPEPGTLALALIGVVGFVARKRRNAV